MTQRHTKTARIIGICVAAILVISAVIWTRKDHIVRDRGEGMSDYSAVFVQGGGIYFGKITQLSGAAMTLDDVFSYGVVNADGTPVSTSATSTGTQRPTIFDATKVGVAPGKTFHFTRSQVLVYYTLKTDSEVVTTIEKYKANPNATSAPTATPKS